MTFNSYWWPLCISTRCRKQIKTHYKVQHCQKTICHTQPNLSQPHNSVGGAKKWLPSPTCKLFQNSLSCWLSKKNCTSPAVFRTRDDVIWVASIFKKIGSSDLPQWHCSCWLELPGSMVANDTPNTDITMLSWGKNLVVNVKSKLLSTQLIVPQTQQPQLLESSKSNS